jgi:D-psicose/D-tagatose/L-ribulose 3-epimerase
MYLSLCNEVLRDHDFSGQCRIAAALGYQGLEVAPFTLAEDPFSLSDKQIAGFLSIAEDYGLTVTGLHWLLVAPSALSITTDDPDIAARTQALLERLVEICALFKATVLVHGSPGQRALAHASSADAARANALGCFEKVAGFAAGAGVTYCIEPLGKNQTDYINTVADAIELVDAVNSPAFRTMIDTSSAGVSEPVSVADTIRKYWSSGKIAHVQINDTNLRAPGQGKNEFTPIFQALNDVGYDGVVAVEPFDYDPDGATTAAFAAGYVRGVLENM